jgi:hypothetical protein
VKGGLAGVVRFGLEVGSIWDEKLDEIAPTILDGYVKRCFAAVLRRSIGICTGIQEYSRNTSVPIGDGNA